MIIRRLNIPFSEYPKMIHGKDIEPEHHALLSNLLTGQERVVLFGDMGSARFFSRYIAESLVACQTSTTFEFGFHADFDVLFVAVSPAHYQDVLANIPRWTKGKDITVVLPFEEFEPEIRCILETQPRCGTEYLANSLLRSLDCNYATIFPSETHVFTGTPYRHAGLFFDRTEETKPYVVKTHFFDRARDLAYSDRAKYIRLFGYPFDGVYFWARDVIVHSLDKHYRLLNTSSEWRTLKTHLYENRCWMLEVTDELVIRYEDLHADFSGTTGRIAECLGTKDNLIMPFIKTDRMYFNDGYQDKMDYTVFCTIKEIFKEPLARFYPEKSACLPEEPWF